MSNLMLLQLSGHTSVYFVLFNLCVATITLYASLSVMLQCTYSNLIANFLGTPRLYSGPQKVL